MTRPVAIAEEVSCAPKGREGGAESGSESGGESRAVANLEYFGSLFEGKSVCLLCLAVLACAPCRPLLTGEGRLVERREF